MDPLLWIVFVSAALSGFFSLTAYSLRASRRTGLEEAFKGPSGRGRLETLERHFRALRLTASFCRALANLILVVAMVYLIGERRHGLIGAVGAIVAAAAVIAVFGVAIPHAWASYAGEKILAATLGVQMFFYYALYPLTWLMASFDVPIRRLAGAADRQGNDDESARQEILQAASEGRAEGAVNAEEEEMIASVIEFGETHAGEIMTPRTDVFAIPADTPLAQAAREVFHAGHSRVPIYENDLDNIVGILYAKDMLQLTDSSKVGSIREIMRQPFFVPETKPLDDLLREFKDRKIHIAVILDEYGGTAGLVTIEDVLEEIVGEISDEYDRSEPVLMNRLDERTAEVDGRLRIDDLNDAMGLGIPEDEDYDTVAGLVFSELGYIPPAGEQMIFKQARFTILAANDRKITKLRVELTNSQNEES